MLVGGEITHSAHPNFDFESVPFYNLTIIASDGQNSSSSSLDVVISDVNEEPNITSTGVTAVVYENDTMELDLLAVAAIDPDGDQLTYSIVYSNPATASFAINATSWSFCIVPCPSAPFICLSLRFCHHNEDKPPPSALFSLKCTSQLTKWQRDN